MDDTNDEEASNSKSPLTCLKKDFACKSKACETVVECPSSSYRTNCFSIFTPVQAPSSNQTSAFIINADSLSKHTHMEVIHAGCWSGGDECLSPSSLDAKIKDQFSSFSMTNRNYTIPKSLLDPKVLNMCIGFLNEADHNGHVTCCCMTDECNKNIYLTNEDNPYSVMLGDLNPKATTKVTPPWSQPTGNSGKSSLTRGELNAILYTSTAFLFLFLCICVVVFVYKKRNFFFTNKNQMPPVFYQKSNSSENNTGPQTTTISHSTNLPNHLLPDSSNSILLQSAIGNRNAIISDYLASNNNKNHHQLFTNEEYKSLTQPLLMQQPAFASSIIAPNIQVSNNMNAFGGALANKAMQPQPPPSLSRQHFIIDYPNNIAMGGANGGLENTSNIISSQSIPSRLNQQVMIGNLVMEEFESRKDEKDEEELKLDVDMSEMLPKNLKATDLYLIEKKAHGQFSSVWKARCLNSKSNTEADPPAPEYAIKIFASHQKSAWVNEKDIYNALSSTNPNILRYFGSDTHELLKSEKQNQPIMFANFSVTANYEYWIMTEYHECGSLYDFLKDNYLSWPQMVRILNCILDGLAYLHSENLEIKKNFTIAHRDLKSKNILMKSDGQSCCIGDFGLALKLNNSNKLSSSDIRSKVGTRRYMSPELIEGAIAFTKETFLRIDVYACALVLWEIISRGDFYKTKCEYRLPFEDEVGQNPSLEEMKEVLVDKNQRPIIKNEWVEFPGNEALQEHMKSVVKTIEECWDIDLDARISSECAASRIRKIFLAGNPPSSNT